MTTYATSAFNWDNSEWLRDDMIIAADQWEDDRMAARLTEKGVRALLASRANCLLKIESARRGQLVRTLAMLEHILNEIDADLADLGYRLPSRS